VGEARGAMGDMPCQVTEVRDGLCVFVCCGVGEQCVNLCDVCAGFVLFVRNAGLVSGGPKKLSLLLDWLCFGQIRPDLWRCVWA